MRISGIYQIQSKSKPKRIYVGSAMNIGNRWSSHLLMLRKHKHHSIKLQNHYNKYGEEDLQLSVLIGCEKEDLIKHEQFFIDSLNPWFNICKYAGSSLGRAAWNKGKKTPKEVTEKWRQSRKLNPYIPTKETKQKLREASIKAGCKPPNALGLKRSDKTRRLISESHMGNKYALGCKRSEEVKRRSSERQKGRKLSEEHKQKLSESHKGITTWNKGKHYSEEIKKKISDAKILYYANKRLLKQEIKLLKNEK